MKLALRAILCAVPMVAACRAVAAPSLSLSRSVPGSAYSPGRTVDVTVMVNAVTEGNTFYSLGFEESVPGGWVFSQVVSSTKTLHIAPTSNESDGVLDFAFAGSVTTFPQSVTYRLIVPGGDTGQKQIAGAASGVYSITTISTSTTATSLAFDNTAPTVTINQAAAQSDPTKASPINFTVVFSEAINPATFKGGDVTITGTAGGAKTVVLSTSNNITWNAAVSGMTTNGTVIATITANMVQDLAGNDNAASTSSDKTVNWDVTVPNTTTITPATTGPTNASSVAFAVTFSESVQNFNNSSDVVITHTGTASTGVTITGGPTTYTATVTGITGNGLFTLKANTASDIQDLAGNALGTTVTSAAVAVDKTAPTVDISAPAPLGTRTGPVAFTVTYGGASSITLATSHVTLVKTGTASAASVVVWGNGTTSRTVTLNNTSGSGTLAIHIAAGTASDAAGNLAPASANSAACSVSAAPTISITAPTAGAVYTKGLIKPIQWSSTSPNSKVNVTVYRGASPVKTIGTNLSNGTVNSVNWTVGGGLTPASDYYVHLKYPDDTEEVVGSAFTVADAFTITQPTAGVSWQAGAKHNITWQSTADVGNAAKLKLLKNGQFASWIGGVVPNVAGINTFANWYPRSTFTPGSDYTIYIYKPDYSLTAQSAPFTISDPSISLTRPNAVDKYLVPGAPLRVAWTTSLPGATQFKVRLDRPNQSTRFSPTSFNASSAYYDWAVPGDVPLGTDYTLYLYDVSVNYKAQTPALSVVDLLVTSPAGGETWAGGSAHTVTWKASPAVDMPVSGVTKKMKVKLVKGPNSTDIKFLASNLPNSGSANVTLPTLGAGTGQITAGNDYRIVVYREDYAFLAGSNAITIGP